MYSKQWCIDLERENLLLSGQTEALDVGNLVEESGDRILVDIERQVADKDGLALGAQLVVELLGAIVGTVLEIVLGLGAGEIDPHVTVVEVATLLSLEGSLGILSGVEVDVAEATRATVLSSDNTSVGAASGALELLKEGSIIDLPAEVTDEQSRALLLAILGLVLLGRGLSLLLLSLALLGGGLGLLLGGVGLRVVRIVGVIGVVIRVVAVI